MKGGGDAEAGETFGNRQHETGSLLFWGSHSQYNAARSSLHFLLESE
jgi:hypothetical protein